MQKITSDLLRWYRKNRILYPWRRTRDPYRVWLSEILLQQTRIPVALRYYEKILKLFPDLACLARAEEAEFLSAWSGIGYYGRARNMVRCAREIMEKHNGRFPSDMALLLSLPGIGPYTAGAIRNLCFDTLTPALDGNIHRVLSRVTNNHHLIHTRQFRSAMEEAFLAFGQGVPPSEYMQAWMELGENICLPQPQCAPCPVKKHCAGAASGMAAKLPRTKAARKLKKFFWYFLILEQKKAVLFVQNGSRGFLKDSWIFPDILGDEELSADELRGLYSETWGIDVRNLRQVATVTHAVTFRKIEAHAFVASNFRMKRNLGKWLTLPELNAYHTSSITQKILNKI